jgi:hypothetical protein
MSQIQKPNFVKIVLPGKSRQEPRSKGSEPKAEPPPVPEQPERRKLTEAEWRRHYQAVARERAAKEAAKEAADFEEAIKRADLAIAEIQAEPQITLAGQWNAMFEIHSVLEDLGHEDDPRIKKLSELVTKREHFLDKLEEEASQDASDLEPVELEPLPSLATVLKAAPTGLFSNASPESGPALLCVAGVIIGVVITVFSSSDTGDLASALPFGAFFGSLLFIPGMILAIAQACKRAKAVAAPAGQAPAVQATFLEADKTDVEQDAKVPLELLQTEAEWHFQRMVQHQAEVDAAIERAKTQDGAHFTASSD